MWTEITGAKYQRKSLRYASSVTDVEWALIEPFMPLGKSLGRPRTMDLCEVANALLHLLRGGGPWHALPKDFPLRSTV